MDAPLPPLEIDSLLQSFDRELQNLFVRKKAKSNLRKFQEGLVDSLCSDNVYIVATADKGLGPVRVEAPRYIRDCLVHITNAKTYQIISEE